MNEVQDMLHHILIIFFLITDNPPILQESIHYGRKSYRQNWDHSSPFLLSAINGVLTSPELLAAQSCHERCSACQASEGNCSHKNLSSQQSVRVSNTPSFLPEAKPAAPCSLFMVKAKLVPRRACVCVCV